MQHPQYEDAIVVDPVEDDVPWILDLTGKRSQVPCLNAITEI